MNYDRDALNLSQYGDIYTQNIRADKKNKYINAKREAAERLGRLRPGGKTDTFESYKLNNDGRYAKILEESVPRRVHAKDPGQSERLRKAILSAYPTSDYSQDLLNKVEKISLERKDLAIDKALKARKSKLLQRFQSGVVSHNVSKDWINYTELAARNINSFLDGSGWELGTINGQYVAKSDNNQLLGNILYLRNILISKSSSDYFSVAWGVVNGWNRWASTFVNKKFNLGNEEKQLQAATSKLAAARRMANRLKTDAHYQVKIAEKDNIRQEKARAREEAIANYRRNLQL